MMENKHSDIQNKKIVRVVDILEQVASLNQMIELHKKKSGNDSMLTQYEYMKKEFIQELNSILLEFNIKMPAA